MWSEHPDSMRAKGIPPGFCATCEFCGDFGHASHYPGPLPYTGSWCDVCYKVESHLSPSRDSGTWAYDARRDEEFGHPDFESESRIAPFMDVLESRKSAVTINHPDRNSIDFRSLGDGKILFRYNDYEGIFFVDGLVHVSQVKDVLRTCLSRQNLRTQFEAAGYSFKYFEE